MLYLATSDIDADGVCVLSYVNHFKRYVQDGGMAGLSAACLESKCFLEHIT